MKRLVYVLTPWAMVLGFILLMAVVGAIETAGMPVTP